MNKLFLVMACVVIALFAAASALDPLAPPQQDIYDAYLSVFNTNLEWSGTDAIVAARSKQSPNYFYDWVRDSALALRTLQEIHGTNSTAMGSWYERYERSVQGQLTKNEYGVDGVDVRGEVKYEVDGSLFRGPWGRPQVDGSAARTIIRIDYAFYRLARGQTDQVRQIWHESRPGLKWELQYIMDMWDKNYNVDLWEESRGLHFYSFATYRKALIWGARLAYALNDQDAAYNYLAVAMNIAKTLQSRFIAPAGHIWPMIDVQSSPADRLGFDTAVILGGIVGDMDSAILTGELNSYIQKHIRSLGCNNVRKANVDNDIQLAMPFLRLQLNSGDDQRCNLLKEYRQITSSINSLSALIEPSLASQNMLASLYGLINWSRDNFVVNKNLSPRYISAFVARYPNDVYDGTGVSRGNPWLLSNFASAELLTRFANKMKRDGNIVLEQFNYQMIVDLTKAAVLGKQCSQNTADKLVNDLGYGKVSLQSNDERFTCLYSGLKSYSLLTANLPFEQLGFPADLPEQCHRDSGVITGAHYLTWSYSTFLSWYQAYTQNK